MYLSICFFEKQSDRETERERETQREIGPPSVDDLQPRLGQADTGARSSIWISNRMTRDPTLLIHPLLHSRQKLELKT